MVRQINRKKILLSTASLFLALGLIFSAVQDSKRMDDGNKNVVSISEEGEVKGGEIMANCSYHALCDVPAGPGGCRTSSSCWAGEFSCPTHQNVCCDRGSCDSCNPCTGVYQGSNNGCPSTSKSCTRYDCHGSCGTTTLTCYLIQYSISYSAGNGGSISGATNQSVCYNQSGSQVTAVANSGYTFSQWSDGNTSPSRSDVATGNKSFTASFTMNTPPTAPTAPLTNGMTNPTDVASTPYFSAIFNDADSTDTGVYYQIQVNTNSSFSGTTMWDSGKTAMTATNPSSRSPNINYAGNTLSYNGTTYYWRIRFWDNNGADSPWSATAQFTMNTIPTAPTSPQTNGETNPTGVTTSTPYFSAIFNDPDSSDTGVHYQIQVNTNSSFTGTTMWDSTKTAMTSTANGSRSPNINYNGTALTQNGTTYYWRIKFWDNNGAASPWSVTAQFTMSSTPTIPLNLVAYSGVSEVSLMWSKPSYEGNGVTDYIIQYSSSGGSTWSTFADGVSSNTYTTVTGLTNGTLYTFRVAAVSSAGTGPYSNTVQSTPQGISVSSVSPTNYSFLGGGSMTINVSGIIDTSGYISIHGGGGHTCGIGVDKSVYCWGYNSSGELGNDSTQDSTVPVKVQTSIKFVQITLGAYHTCGLTLSGAAYCWGNNGNGRLGNGGTTNAPLPVAVTKPASTPANFGFISITGAQEHTCAIGNDNKVYCWGTGADGRLGNGDTNNKLVPTLVSQGDMPAGAGVRGVDVGFQHTCAIGTDNKGYCWGNGGYGKLGNGDTNSRLTPTLVSAGDIPTNVTFQTIQAGRHHSCMLGSNGNPYCWGKNDHGHLGNNSTTFSPTPVAVVTTPFTGYSVLSDLSLGDEHSCIIGSSSSSPGASTKIFCWGWGSFGMIGNGGTGDALIPTMVNQGTIPSGAVFSDLSTGLYHSCVLSDNKGYCWGGDAEGRLGSGQAGNQLEPVAVVPGENVNNKSYEINIGNNVLPRELDPGTTSINISPIPAHVPGNVSISIKRLEDNVSSNSVSFTYNNLPGPSISNINPSTVKQSGGETVNITGSNFLDYGPFKTLSSVSTGNAHACAIGSNGKGYCWGNGGNGRLGNGSTAQQTTPVAVSQGSIPSNVTLSSISAGTLHTCAIGSNNRGYCWGVGASGQLGNGGTTQRTTPVAVSQGSIPSNVTLSSISAGSTHTCAVGNNGKGYCWGSGTNGRLGNGSTAQQTTPVAVTMPSGVTFSSISAGGNHTCAIGNNGKGYCWGSGTNGRLGNGDTTQQTTPVAVTMPSGVTFSSISADGTHTCATGNNGKGYCWGSGTNGRLGNGDTTQQATPVAVSQGSIPSNVTLSSISAASHTCAIDTDSNGYCWGMNNNGQLGNDETTDRPTPSYILLKGLKPTIEFGTTPAASTTYTSTTAMSAVTPALSTSGLITVKLTNPDGQYTTRQITVIAPPTAPRNLSATTGNKQVSLTWTVPSSNGGSAITDYVVQYSINNSTWITFNDGVSTATSATVTGLTNGTLYYFRVAAVNSVGTGPYTSSVTATPVNQIPSFTGMSYNNTVNPGGTVTWTATASDSDGQVKLLVCKTAQIYNGACVGGEWCSSTLVNSNPSCSHNVDNPTPSGLNQAYAYVVDNDNEPASGGYQGQPYNFTVNEVAPTITNIVLNGGNNITLEEGTTKIVVLTAQVVSANTCSSINTVKGYIYRSGIGYTGCDTSAEGNDNHCYPELTCIIDTNSSRDCSNPTDESADYICTANVQFFADPTDTNVQYSAQTWLASVSAKSGSSTPGVGHLSTGIEMNSLAALAVSPSMITYGTLLAGQSNGTLNTVITSISKGNVPIHQRVQGDGPSMCTDFFAVPNCQGGTPIPVGNQKYSLASGTGYNDSAAVSLTTNPDLVLINIPKPTSTTPASKNTWWGVKIPNTALIGEYDGRVFVTPVKINQ